jgi:hypothetical protein
MKAGMVPDVGEHVVETACQVVQRQIVDLDDLIDQANPESWTPITPAEWEIIAGEEHLTEEQLRKKKYEKWLNKDQQKTAPKRKKRKKGRPAANRVE